MTTLQMITKIAMWLAFWNLFWTLVNAFLPPREIFKDCTPSFQKKYNTILMLVGFYGAINIRQLTVQMYSAVNQDVPSTPPHKLDNALRDAAASTQETAEAVAKAQQAAPAAVPPTGK